MSTTSHAVRSDIILQDQDSTHTQWCYIAGVNQGNSRPLLLKSSTVRSEKKNIFSDNYYPSTAMNIHLQFRITHWKLNCYWPTMSEKHHIH